MGLLFLLCLLVFFVYFLGEHAGSQGSMRSQKVQKITSTKAELDNLKTDLNQTTTPPWILLVAVLGVIYLILKLVGGWADDDHYYHRHRH